MAGWEKPDGRKPKYAPDYLGVITGAMGGSLRGIEAHELLQRRAPPSSPRVRRADKLQREPLRVEVEW